MTNKKYLGIIVAVVVVAVGGIWLFMKGSSPAPLKQPEVPVTTTSETSTPGTNPGAVSGAQPTATVPKTSASHPTTILSPASSAQWVFSQPNTIQWDEAAKITGGIYLVNAANGSVDNWILGQTGPSQTSFS